MSQKRDRKQVKMAKGRADSTPAPRAAAVQAGTPAAPPAETNTGVRRVFLPACSGVVVAALIVIACQLHHACAELELIRRDLQDFHRAYGVPSGAAPSTVNARFSRPGAVKPTSLAVADVNPEGSFIRLDNGTLWKVADEDREFAPTWETKVAVRIEKTGDAAFPYRLVNTDLNQAVDVRAAQ